MRVLDVHQRTLSASAEQIGPLIDSLSSREDRLWPHDRWPAMRFDRPLAEGARGGHGPIRYSVAAYDPGRRVVFELSGPRGLYGVHRFELEEISAEQVVLRHVIEMNTSGPGLLTWPLVIHPLHNALIEDALDRAEVSVGGQPPRRSWSPWVKFLRRMLAGKRRSPSSGGA